jgi:hypothetical protein
MAERGGQKGNNNAGIGRDGRMALQMALDNHGSDEPIKAIGRIATLIKMWQPIIDKAMEEGDLAAMKEINDRLDGKPAQSIMLSGDEDNPVAVTQVERIIVKPSNPDS